MPNMVRFTKPPTSSDRGWAIGIACGCVLTIGLGPWLLSRGNTYAQATGEMVLICLALAGVGGIIGWLIGRFRQFKSDDLTKIKTRPKPGLYFGGPAGIRTQDTRLKRPLL